MSAAAGLVLLAAASAPTVALECPTIAGQTLVYIDIYDGPPEQQADLAPDRTIKPSAGNVSNLWELVAGQDGLFVKCGYGKALAGPYSHIEMIRLPDTVKNCRADFKTGAKPNDLILTKFACE